MAALSYGVGASDNDLDSTIWQGDGLALVHANVVVAMGRPTIVNGVNTRDERDVSSLAHR